MFAGSFCCFKPPHFVGGLKPQNLEGEFVVDPNFSKGHMLHLGKNREKRPRFKHGTCRMKVFPDFNWMIFS